MPTALITTVCSTGGAATMTKFVADTLHDAGIEPVVAHYQPYSLAPELSVPSYCLLRRRVSQRTWTTNGYRHHAIGAWLPEFEFTHYLPTKYWRRLIAESDFHLSVSGNCLAATPYAWQAVPFWAWVATPWDEDRAQRAQAFSPPRKLFDRCVTAPGARCLQRLVLRSGKIMALSEYTRRCLRSLAGSEADLATMPMGVDTEKFKPERRAAPRHRVGFVGRLSDPRKNVNLLLQTAAWCQTHWPDSFEFVLIGGGGDVIERKISEHGVGDVVTVTQSVKNEDLNKYLNTLDVFVIPSHQEGLCIAALEAMSCGVPVVSTRCGGPEEFVLNDETGFVAEAEPEDFGRAIQEIARSSERRAYMGAGARSLVERKYSIEAVRRVFWQSFEEVFGNNPIHGDGDPGVDVRAARSRAAN